MKHHLLVVSGSTLAYMQSFVNICTYPEGAKQLLFGKVKKWTVHALGIILTIKKRLLFAIILLVTNNLLIIYKLFICKFWVVSVQCVYTDLDLSCD